MERVQIFRVEEMPRHLQDLCADDKYNYTYITYGMNDDEKKDDELYKWLKDNGATDDTVYIFVSW